MSNDRWPMIGLLTREDSKRRVLKPPRARVSLRLLVRLRLLRLRELEANLFW
jgi:hypothetical protein